MGLWNWITNEGEKIFDSTLSDYNKSLDNYKTLRILINHKIDEFDNQFDNCDGEKLENRVTTNGIVSNSINLTLDAYEKEYNSILVSISNDREVLNNVQDRIDVKISEYEQKIKDREYLLENN